MLCSPSPLPASSDARFILTSSTLRNGASTQTMLEQPSPITRVTESKRFVWTTEVNAAQKARSAPTAPVASSSSTDASLVDNPVYLVTKKEPSPLCHPTPLESGNNSSERVAINKPESTRASQTSNLSMLADVAESLNKRKRSPSPRSNRADDFVPGLFFTERVAAGDTRSERDTVPPILWTDTSRHATTSQLLDERIPLPPCHSAGSEDRTHTSLPATIVDALPAPIPAPTSYPTNSFSPVNAPDIRARVTLSHSSDVEDRSGSSDYVTAATAFPSRASTSTDTTAVDSETEPARKRRRLTSSNATPQDQMSSSAHRHGIKVTLNVPGRNRSRPSSLLSVQPDSQEAQGEDRRSSGPQSSVPIDGSQFTERVASAGTAGASFSSNALGVNSTTEPPKKKRGRPPLNRSAHKDGVTPSERIAADGKRSTCGNSHATAFTSTSLLAVPKESSKKRKRSPLCHLASSEDVSVDSESASARELTPSRSKKRAAGSSTPKPSRASTIASSPEPIEQIFRSNRSRSTSALPSAQDRPVRGPCHTEEDGAPNYSSLIAVKGLMKQYKAHFKNPNDPNDKSFEPHPTDYPVGELEYPNNDAVERYMLLAPKDPDHYSPVLCLEKTLHAIIAHYLTPAQQSLFGKLPSKCLMDSTDDDEILGSSSPERSSSPVPSAPICDLPKVDLIRQLQRSINHEDGPKFMETLDSINQLLRTLKYPSLPDDPYAPARRNPLKEAPRSWASTGLPDDVLYRLVEESYQRCVGPKVPALQRYEAFSSEVYGELMPNFTTDIVKTTGLCPGKLLLDLGSGVANVVLQASLESGCDAYGIEVMPTPAAVAEDQKRQYDARCRMWALSYGNVELEHGDMLKSKRVDELMPKADVVLVNNKVFLEPLNEALRPKFLDLKEGAVVVSLKPFVRSLNARVTERNIDDISAIFDVTERSYASGSVSWGNSGGSYYVHRVDREGYRQIHERFETVVRGRASRFRRVPNARGDWV